MRGKNTTSNTGKCWMKAAPHLVVHVGQPAHIILPFPVTMPFPTFRSLKRDMNPAHRIFFRVSWASYKWLDAAMDGAVVNAMHYVNRQD